MCEPDRDSRAHNRSVEVAGTDESADMLCFFPTGFGSTRDVNSEHGVTSALYFHSSKTCRYRDPMLKTVVQLVKEEAYAVTVTSEGQD